MLDIISIGDATIDVFLTVDEAEAKCSVDSRKCELCFSYADKVPVSHMQRIDGAGNASNNAVGSARLGMRNAIFTVVGNDGTGEQMIRHWQKEDIDTSLAVIDEKRGTNYSTVLTYAGERTILVFHEQRDYRFPAGMPPASWVYYTSLGKGSESMHDDLIAYVQRTGAKLAFQPGTFQLKLGMSGLAPLIAASEIAIMNKEEAERLLETGTKPVSELLTLLRKAGAKIAVITDGPAGSYTDDGAQQLFLGIFDVPPVERTGCGDAYATALVAALHQGETLAEAMRWGTANSASVLSYVGPQEGLLTKARMTEFLSRFPQQPETLH